MCVHLITTYIMFLVDITNKTFIPKSEVDGIFTVKSPKHMIGHMMKLKKHLMTSRRETYSFIR